jgi:Rieske Fe-S protein
VTQDSVPETTRRAALASAGLAGVAVALAACSSGSPAAAGSSTSGGGSAGTSGGAASGTSGQSQGGSSGGTPLAAESDIPVGGGKVFAAQQVVVTQPSAGQFKAFSAICTHAHCTVDQVANGTIDCPCHGSMFSIKDGSVAGGPAPSPLPEKQITVSGGKIMLA